MKGMSKFLAHRKQERAPGNKRHSRRCSRQKEEEECRTQPPPVEQQKAEQDKVVFCAQECSMGEHAGRRYMHPNLQQQHT
jgi:hypothetical protein